MGSDPLGPVQTQSLSVCVRINLDPISCKQGLIQRVSVNDIILSILRIFLIQVFYKKLVYKRLVLR